MQTALDFPKPLTEKRGSNHMAFRKRVIRRPFLAPDRIATESCADQLAAENARLRAALLRIQHVSIEYQEAPHHQIARAESIATQALKGESHE